MFACIQKLIVHVKQAEKRPRQTSETAPPANILLLPICDIIWQM